MYDVLKKKEEKILRWVRKKYLSEKLKEIEHK